MGAILKLTATAYLLIGLEISSPLISFGLPENQGRASGKSYVRPNFVQITIMPMLAQDPPPPDKPHPSGESEGAGGRCVIEILDLAV